MLSPEDKQLIAEYMGWEIEFDYYVDHRIKKAINFDSNDSRLCVEKMVEKGDWDNYFYASYGGVESSADFAAWLFNPENFFSAMASWLRSKLNE